MSNVFRRTSMSQKILIRVGKRGAIYIPRRLLEKLCINEGDYVLMIVRDGRIVLEVFPDPFCWQ